MSSQNNNSKQSLKRISNQILVEQNIDIRNYTVGHLNENHLFKVPTPVKNEIRWKTKSNDKKSKSKSKAYSSMSDIHELLGAYNLESPVPSSHYSEPEQVVSGLVKLPSIVDQHRKNLIQVHEKTLESDLKTFPITDKEMAISYLNGPFKGASKVEKFNNFVEFEKAVIQKENLTAKNILHSNERTNWLEKKLQNVRSLNN